MVRFFKHHFVCLLGCGIPGFAKFLRPFSENVFFLHKDQLQGLQEFIHPFTVLQWLLDAGSPKRWWDRWHISPPQKARTISGI